MIRDSNIGKQSKTSKLKLSFWPMGYHKKV